ncbi:MAG: nucleotidyltransferase family protein [Thermoplasmata archaeon]
MVKGVIFAGGYGKRLKPITDKIPKTLIEIRKGYTILDRQLLDFKYAGIDDIYLLVGYKHQIIEKRYGKTWKGLNLHYLIEKKPMGTLWAMKNCSDYVNDNIVVRNGDTISDINLKDFAQFSESKNYYLTIALTKMKSPYAIINIKDDQIVNFIEKPLLNLYINAGIYYLKKDSFKYLNEKYDNKEIEKSFFPKMVDLGLAGSYIDDSKWFPVDNFKDLEELRKEYIGRKDREYGYIKKIKNTYEIYIKKKYVAKIGLKGNFHLIRGKGILNKNFEVDQGYAFLSKETFSYYALENSIIVVNK